MKKQIRNILLVFFCVVLIIGMYLFAGRLRSMPGLNGDVEWIMVEDNRCEPPVKLELTEGELDILKLKLKGLKIRWNGGRVQPFSVDQVEFFVDYIADGTPFHLVLGEPCFAYESAGEAKYLIVQDDDYRRLIEELRHFAEP